MRFFDLFQKAGHAFGIHFLGSHEVKGAIPRAHGGIFIPELPDQGQMDSRPIGCGCPT